MDKYTRNNLVFTLADDKAAEEILPETAQTPDTGDREDTGMAEWEKNLMRLQQKRNHQYAVAARSVQQSVPLHSPTESRFDRDSVLQAARRRKLDVDEQKQANQAYLKYWQQQHNEQASQVSSGQTDVLFEEDWGRQQTHVVVNRDAEPADRVTVLVSSNRRAQALAGQNILERLEALDAERAAGEDQEEQHSATNPPSAASTSPPVDWAEVEKIVLLNVYKPAPQTRNQVMCLNEEVLLTYLNEKLRPHLADAVAGMIKTVVQRRSMMMVQELQQTLADSIPELVDDVLKHNLERALNAIKREQRKAGMLYGKDEGDVR